MRDDSTFWQDDARSSVFERLQIKEGLHKGLIDKNILDAYGIPY